MKTPTFIATSLIVLGGLFGNCLRYVEQMPEEPPSFGAIPYQANGYIGEERRFADYSYEILKADTTTLRLYRGPEGGPFWMFVAYFPSQKYGSQIHSPKQCLPGGGWRIETIQPFHLPLPDGTSKTVNQLIISHETESQLMLYWFETRGGTITSEFALKWDLVINSLLFRPTDAGLVRLTVPIAQGDIEAASEKIVHFFSAFYPGLKEALPFDN